MREIFSAFEAQGAAGAETSSSYTLHLAGNATGTFVLRVGPDGVHWSQGADPASTATIRIDTNDFIAIADGSLDGRLALASEKIEIEGDLEAASGLLRLFFPADPES